MNNPKLNEEKLNCIGYVCDLYFKDRLENSTAEDVLMAINDVIYAGTLQKARDCIEDLF